MCQQSSSRIQNEPGYRKRQFLSITTRHQRKGLRKMLELKEVKKKNKKKTQEQTSNKKEEGERNRLPRKEQKKDGKKKEKKRRKKFVSRALIHITSISLSVI